jgi:hypothetical protein
MYRDDAGRHLFNSLIATPYIALANKSKHELSGYWSAQGLTEHDRCNSFPLPNGLGQFVRHIEEDKKTTIDGLTCGSWVAAPCSEK